MKADDGRELNQQARARLEGRANGRTSSTNLSSGVQGQSCTECGGQIEGRRRNGFCSDRCRLRYRRRAQVQRVQVLVVEAERAYETGSWPTLRDALDQFRASN